MTIHFFKLFASLNPANAGGMLNHNSSIILKVSIILYALTFSFCSTQDAPFTKDDQVSDFLKEKYRGIILSEYKDEFSYETLSEILIKPVVLDTVIVSARNYGNEFRLKALVLNANNSKIFAEFKCTKEIFEQYLASECTIFIAAASISKIDNVHVYADIFTIDQEELLIGAGDDIFLAGSCIEMIESPLQKKLLTQNLN